MKKKIILALLIINYYIVYGQTDEVPKVGFLVYNLQPYSDPILNNTAFKTALYTNVSNSVANLKRFSIIPAEEMSVVDKVVDIQKGEQYMNSQIVESGNRLGAEMIIYVLLGALVYEREEHRNQLGQVTSISYSGKASYTIRCVDIRTGKLKFSKLFTGKTPSTFYKPHKIFTTNSNTPEGAIHAAIEDSKSDVDEWLRMSNPVEFKIIRFSEQNGKYELIIKGGLNIGLKKSIKKLYVKIKEIVEGDILQTNICPIKIEEVQDNLTRCSITNGDALKLKAIWDNDKKKSNLCVMENKDKE